MFLIIIIIFIDILQRVGRVFDESDLVQDNINRDIYHSWDHHSIYSGMSPKLVVNKMNNDIITANKNIKNSNILFITLGTSKVYQLINENNRIISNCHKQPGSLFLKRDLNIQEMTTKMSETFKSLKILNPNLKVKNKIKFICRSYMRFYKNNYCQHVITAVVLLFCCQIS